MTDIYHSGIKGQRKGVRRYQYKNGTYTREGNLRYRPPKGDGPSEKALNRIILGTLLGEMALVTAKSSQAHTQSMSIPAIIAASKQTLATLSANKVATGKAITNAVLKVPAPVRAMVLPLAAVGVGVGVASLVMNGEQIADKFKELPWDKIASGAISVGASAVGMALATSSGNPAPAIIGMTISTILSTMEKDEY